MIKRWTLLGLIVCLIAFFQNCGRPGFDSTATIVASSTTIVDSSPDSDFKPGPTPLDSNVCSIKANILEVLAGDTATVTLTAEDPLPDQYEVVLVSSLNGEVSPLSLAEETSSSWMYDGTKAGVGVYYFNVRDSQGTQICRTSAVSILYVGYSCQLQADKTIVKIGESVNFIYRLIPNVPPPGARAAWIETKTVNGVTNTTKNGLISFDLTSFDPVFKNVSNATAGIYTRSLIIRSSAGLEICQTNQVAFSFLKLEN